MRHLDELTPLLARQRLLPLLGARLRGIAGVLPDPFLERVEAATEAARRLAHAQTVLSLRCLAALEHAGVRAVALKGPLMSEELHGAPGLRQSDDLDLLVSPENVDAALAALAQLGWRSHVADGSSLHHRLEHATGLPSVELHWRVHWYENRFAAAALARSVRRPDGVRRLAPSDLLVCMLLFYARDGFVGLRAPVDLAAWWDRYGCSVADPLQATMQEHPALRRALGTASVALENLTGVPARALVGDPTPVSTTALRLANPLFAGSREQVMAEMAVVDGLLAPSRRTLTFVRRQVILGQAELRAREGRLANAHAIRVAGHQLLHAIRLSARCARAAVRPSAAA